MLINLSTARNLLWSYAMSTPLATATTAEKAQFLQYLNMACARLLSGGKWRGTRQQVTIPIVDGMITLPRYFDSCLGVKLSNECCSYRNLFGMFYPYQGAGCECSGGVVAVSEIAQTFIVPNEPFQLKVVSLQADNGKKIQFINGVDEDGKPIYATDELTMDDGIPPTTYETYSKLPVIQKDATVGLVEIYSVIDGQDDLIAIYAPSETIPSYKQYRISQYSNEVSVDALCKLAFVEAVNDTDLVFPPVIGALSKAIKAVIYEIKSDDREVQLWAEAQQILEDDRYELDGKTIPVVEVIGDFGAGRTSNLQGWVDGFQTPFSNYGY